MDIQLTDDVGTAVPDIKIDFSQPSSLVKYARAEVLHLLVVPDFVSRARQSLSVAAAEPVSFESTLEHEFQLGNATPTINLQPFLKATIRANAKTNADLFETDPFQIPATVPPDVGYVSLCLQGSLSPSVSSPTRDLTFGIDANQTIAIEFWKAFPLGNGEPTMGAAVSGMISDFVIPADVSDLNSLGVNDLATVSGQGSLKISGGFNVSLIPNPLASADLPLNTGSVDVKAGVMAGVQASFAISGSYQIRVRRIAEDSIELSFYKQRGTSLTTALSASAGVSANFGDADLLQGLLGAIATDPNDEETRRLFQAGGLSTDQIATLNGAIKDALDHTLQASLDITLSRLTDDQAAFQYECRPGELSAEGRGAINRALGGDLSGLTAFERDSHDPVLAPGITLISSVLTSARRGQSTMHLNLIGLVNVLSLSRLVRESVVIKDPGTGYLTIADSSTASRIDALVEPQRRREAIRQAMFESLMVTASYRVSKTVELASLASHNFHFAFNENTNAAVFAEYLNWFVDLNLLDPQQTGGYALQFRDGGASTCLLRTDFDDAGCRKLYFKSPGFVWDRDHYIEIGRRTMLALISRGNNDTDRFRRRLLEKDWDKAEEIGPNDNLGPLVGLQLTDPASLIITQYLRSDVYTIVWWADAMRAAGAAILEMQKFLNRPNTAVLADEREFAQRRAQLQHTLASAIKKSQVKFGEPWGLLALYLAAGSQNASGRVVAKGVVVQKP